MRSARLTGALLTAFLITASIGCERPQSHFDGRTLRLFPDAERRVVNGGRSEKRFALEAPVPSRLRDTVEVPPGGVLHWSYAVRSDEQQGSIRISVLAGPADRLTTLTSAELALPLSGEPRFTEGRADLGGFEGQRIEVVLEAERIADEDLPTPSPSPSRIDWASTYVSGEVASSDPATSILLVVVDTLRADRLGVYGSARATPHLDELASRGTVFQEAVSQTNWTLPSMASLFSGLYPMRHGVTSPGRRLSRDGETLAEVLFHDGYVTAGFHGGAFVGARFGFGRGFGEYHQVEGLEEGLGMVSRWLRKNRDLPFFLFLHTYDVHAPYASVPREYWSLYADPIRNSRRLQQALPRRMERAGHALSAEEIAYLSDLYDGEVRYVDDRMGQLLDELDRLGLAETTTVVVTADHGESFGERGMVGHRTHNLHQELVRVPLIIAGPGISSGRRVDAVVQLVDLRPTLLDLLGLEDPLAGTLDGTSFADRLRPPPDAATNRPDRRAWSEFGGLTSVRSSRWTLLADSEHGVELYDRAADPEETIDVSRDHPEIVEQIRGALRDRIESRVEDQSEIGAEVDADLLDELRALGYVD